MGLSNARISHKLVQNTCEAFCINLRTGKIEKKRSHCLVDTVIGEETCVLLCHLFPCSIQVEHAIVLHLQLQVVQAVLDCFIHVMNNQFMQLSFILAKVLNS